jgi:hypothetical protein
LQEAQGDDYAENGEVLQRFFDGSGALRPDAISRLHRDVTFLLLPSPQRALALDRAYLATVREQSFVRGRDTLIDALRNVIDRAPPDEHTGVRQPIRYQ